MQDVDRPHHIQALPQPARARCPRVEVEPLCVVLGSKGLDRIGGQCDWRRDLGQRPAIGPPEPERAVRLPIDLIALLVNRAMVPATQHGEVRERGRPTLRPMLDVMPLAEREPAAREAAAVIPVMESAPQRRGDRPRSGPNFHEAPVPIVLHHDPARVTRQAAGRFRGNVCAPLEDGLAGLLRVRQRRGVDVDHHLVPLSRGAGIDPVVESRLREQGQRVCLLLGHRRGGRGRVSRGGGGLLTPAR
jgi:hypothetical protein